MTLVALEKDWNSSELINSFKGIGRLGVPARAFHLQNEVGRKKWSPTIL